MKLSVVLITLPGLFFLQEALCTSLEADEIQEMVIKIVDEAVAGLEQKISKMQDLIEAKDNRNSEKLEKKMTTTVQQLFQPTYSQLVHLRLLPPPTSRYRPGTSCKDLHIKNPILPSGYYWIGKSGSAVKVYCSMEETCGSEAGGWMRVASIDMRNRSHDCPRGLSAMVSYSKFYSQSKRICEYFPLNFKDPKCVSNTFGVKGVTYNRVCGKIIGYQRGAPSTSFYLRGRLGEYYVNGVTLTHGQNPQKHIWTFAGVPVPLLPSYFGNNYFCDADLTQFARIRFFRFSFLETSNPLWDGQGCTSSSCCSFNTPPWFVRDLPSPTTEDIEMRLCSNRFGSTPIEIVELYVQ